MDEDMGCLNHLFHLPELCNCRAKTDCHAGSAREPARVGARHHLRSLNVVKGRNARHKSPGVGAEPGAERRNKCQTAR